MFSSRYLVFASVAATFVAMLALSFSNGAFLVWATIPGALTLLGIRDLLQTKHSILRNYPVSGHLRFIIEAIRPEIQQYLVENDTEEQPFSRVQRNVVYQRAKNVTDSRAFGTKLDVGASAYEWISHSMAPSTLPSADFRITVGANRAKPYSLSVFNISAMSFGALSANAILALNKGAKRGNFAHDTGEGSLSPHHRKYGGAIIWEIGSGYFGCRNEDGSFSAEAFQAVALEEQVKMIEIKLSQGAKPGHGGVLPGPKVTAEIAATRGVPQGVDCISPSSHSAFSSPVELMYFIEKLRNLSGGKPTGFKLCVGHPWELFGIGKAMLETGILPDFIVVDGAEGGTGAAPVEFTDHVGTPLQEGLLMVHNMLVGLNLRDKIKIGASGKVVTAFDIARTLAMGADFVNGARSFMMSLGCIMAGTCNTGKCPTGVATQDPVRQKAIVVVDKAERVYYYHLNTLHALMELVQSAGLHHPSELRPHHIVRRVSSYEVQLLSDLLQYLEPGDLLQGNYRYPLFSKWWPQASAQTFKFEPRRMASLEVA